MIIRRDGCSAVITIPENVLRFMGLTIGDELEIVRMGGKRLVLEGIKHEFVPKKRR